MSDRRSRRLAGFSFSDAQLRRASFGVPVLFGLYSLWLGADSNWDLTNYHLYDPFALLHGKLDLDLAPAGMQSYFNPLLDFLPYLLNQILPAPLTGFLMGVLHGLTFPVLLGIADRALTGSPSPERNRLLFFVAVMGCLSANFLSELGNSMGDDTTALLILCALGVILKSWDRIGLFNRGAVAVLVIAGVLAGAAAGLKLTNAVYALALAAALFAHPGSFLVKLRSVSVVSVGILIGFAVTGGYWLLHMAQHFGNPLYPQFSAVFPNVLTLPVNVADAHWRPKGLGEALLWPFIFALDPGRVGQVAIRQIIWPTAYLLLVGRWLLILLALAVGQHKAVPANPRHRFLIGFFALSYVLWMELFSIYRYLVAIDVLAPLVILIVLLDLFKQHRALKNFAWVMGISALLVLFGGAPTWGHAPWANPLYQADLPVLDEPDHTVAVLYSPANAWAWLATLFPPVTAFAEIHGAFPESDAFKAKMRQMVTDRPGHAFAIIDGAMNQRAETVVRANAKLKALGLLDSAERCERLQGIAARFHLRFSIEHANDPVTSCQLTVVKADDVDLDAANHDLAAHAATAFATYGLVLDAGSCSPHVAKIGSTARVFQWCKLAAR